MTEDLERASVQAIRAAAERLGVDPFRLARFLANGKLADFLQSVGASDALTAERARAASLTVYYLEFLEEEMRRSRGDRSPNDAANGN